MGLNISLSSSIFWVPNGHCVIKIRYTIRHTLPIMTVFSQIAVMNKFNQLGRMGINGFLGSSAIFWVQNGHCVIKRYRIRHVLLIMTTLCMYRVHESLYPFWSDGSFKGINGFMGSSAICWVHCVIKHAHNVNTDGFLPYFYKCDLHIYAIPDILQQFAFKNSLLFENVDNDI